MCFCAGIAASSRADVTGRRTTSHRMERVGKSKHNVMLYMATLCSCVCTVDMQHVNTVHVHVHVHTYTCIYKVRVFIHNTHAHFIILNVRMYNIILFTVHGLQEWLP